MVRAASARRRHRLIADFAAGDGVLLRAARRRWRSALLIATDVRRSAMSRLHAANRDWLVGKCDFLNSRSRAQCAAIRTATDRVSLTLLNPPFSCRGASGVDVSLGDVSRRVSVAMAFVITALRLMRKDGELIAILPAGTLTSEKDELAWQWVRKCGVVRTVSRHGRFMFDGCFPRTALLHVDLRRKPCTKSTTNRRQIPREGRWPVSLIRGSIPMYRVNGLRRGVRVVHSTNLQGGQVVGHSGHVATATRVVSGPAVLLSRVGEPTKEKVVLHLTAQPVALSDCVLGLACRNQGTAIAVRDLITKNWRRLRRGYGGTGAPYITVRRLDDILSSLGVTLSVDS